MSHPSKVEVAVVGVAVVVGGWGACVLTASPPLAASARVSLQGPPPSHPDPSSQSPPWYGPAPYSPSLDVAELAALHKAESGQVVLGLATVPGMYPPSVTQS